MSFIDDSLAPFEVQLITVSKKIERELLALLAEFQSDSGRILSNDANMKLSLAFAKSFKQILKDAGYDKFMHDFANSNRATINELQKISTGTAIALEFTKTDLATFQTLAKIDLSELFNIGDKAGKVLQTDLTASVLSGQSIKDIKKILISKLENNLQRHANTYIATSRQILMQQSELLGVGNRDVAWQYTGPKDNKNREECILGLSQRYFTKDEMENFEATYGLRWNCRHVFQAVPKKFLNEAG